MSDVFIESLMLAYYVGGLPYTTNLGEMLRAKILESFYPRTNNPSLHFRKDEEEQEEQRRQIKAQGRIVKFDIRMANDTLVSSSLCSLIFSRMKQMQKKRWSIMDCELPLCGTAGLWVVDKTAFWQPYSVHSSIMNQREGAHSGIFILWGGATRRHYAWKNIAAPRPFETLCFTKPISGDIMPTCAY